MSAFRVRTAPRQATPASGIPRKQPTGVPVAHAGANSGRLRRVSRHVNLSADAGPPDRLFSVSFLGMLSMAYLLQPVNRPYDPEEPMPTPLGFIADPYPGFFKGTNDLKREFKPVPPEMVHKTINVVGDVPRPDFLKEDGDVDGDWPMPDCFWIGADHYYVSSRFRAVLERYARGAVEYIEVLFNMPASKNPADAYYFINVVGRGQLIDWESSNKRGPVRGRENKAFYSLIWPPAQWAMKAPPPGHPVIWHEVHKEVGDLVCLGSGNHVFVTNALGAALNAAFPGQVRLHAIREL